MPDEPRSGPRRSWLRCTLTVFDLLGFTDRSVFETERGRLPIALGV